MGAARPATPHAVVEHGPGRVGSPAIGPCTVSNCAGQRNEFSVLRPFKIHQPATVDDTVQLLGQFGEEATVYAGGTELLLAMKEGLLSYAHLLDVKNVDGLGQISYDSSGQSLRIGSAVTHRLLESDAEVLREFPLIAEVEKTVANVRVRNVGTLGGNLCFAEPHSDPAALLLLYDAQVESKGSRGSRTFPLEELTLGPYETCLEEDEVLVGVVVPQLPARMAGAYLKFGYHARPTLGLGVALRLDQPLDQTPGGGNDGFQELQSASIQEVRVSVGSVGPKAVRAREAEAALQGKRVGDLLGRSTSTGAGLLDEVGQLAAREADTMDDMHGSAEYKDHLVQVFLRRGLIKALGMNQQT